MSERDNVGREEAGFRQEGQRVGGKQTNIGRIEGDVGHLGDRYYYQQLPRKEVSFPVDNLPPANPHFVGRTEHLQTLADTANAPTTITQAIAGLGGVGKSQLMLHFAHKHRDAYDIIWWLRVDEALAEDFLTLGRALELDVDGLKQEAAVQVVRTWFNSADKRWLLLCDNADETEPRELRAWLPSGANGRILITSRSSRWDALGEVVRLDVFSEEETAQFWTDRFGYSKDTARIETARKALAEDLGRMPLALEHAAAYMSVNDLNAAAYLALYRSRRQELWQRATPPDDYHATITTTWEIAFQKARQTAGAIELLNLCCFLAPNDIPLELMVEHADVLPEELAAVLTDELALNDALTALGRYSLLERADGELNAAMLRVHRLVQVVARDRMGEERRKKWVEAAVDFLASAYPYDEHDMTTWAAAGQLIPHLAAATDLANQIDFNTNLVAYLNNEAGVYLDVFGKLAKAKPYYERALAIREKALGPDPQNEALLRSTATSLNNLGSLLQAMGEYSEARPYFERALAINEKALGPDHPDTAASLNNLGMLLKTMGDYSGARPYFERALTINEKALGPDPQNEDLLHSTATSLNNLGYLLDSMGEYSEARPYYERALAIDEKAFGPDHPDTASDLNNLGALLFSMGEYPKAKPYFERALAIRERALGPHHPDTALSLNNLGELLRVKGDLSEARPYHERALAIRERSLGPHHPDTAASLNNLGLLLKALGDLDGARDYLERALAIFEARLGPEHPNTKVVRGNLAGLETGR